MDASSPEQTRMRGDDAVDYVVGQLWRNPQVRAAARLAAHQKAMLDRLNAFEEGRAQGSTDSWIAGAKAGALCGLLVGMFVGVAGGMFWIALGRAAG